MLADLKIAQFLNETAAGTAVPGGGSVAALSGALAAALVEMVAQLTIGKKGYADRQPEMRQIARSAADLREKLTAAVDRDAAAYREVMAAFSLPRGTAEEKTRRMQAVQEGLKNASRVPLAVAQDGLKLLELAARVVAAGNKNAVTDGAVGALAARAAVLGALYNVRINLAAIKDPDFVAEMMQQTQDLEMRVRNREAEILSTAGI